MLAPKLIAALALFVPLVLALTEGDILDSGRVCDVLSDQTTSTVFCVFTRPKTWLKSLETCYKDGGILSDFSSRAEHDFLLALAKKAGIESSDTVKIWLGGTDLEAQTFRWITNARDIPAKHFHPNEPNRRCQQKCICLYLPYYDGTSFILDNCNCGEPAPFFCKY